MSGVGKICIGTSGRQYKQWIERFYPEGTKTKDFRNYYLKFFKNVELNNSFYHLPSAETFKTWREVTPDDLSSQ